MTSTENPTETKGFSTGTLLGELVRRKRAHGRRQARTAVSLPLLPLVSGGPPRQRARVPPLPLCRVFRGLDRDGGSEAGGGAPPNGASQADATRHPQREALAELNVLAAPGYCAISRLPGTFVQKREMAYKSS